jgi:hypothetical protein
MDRYGLLWRSVAGGLLLVLTGPWIVGLALVLGGVLGSLWGLVVVPLFVAAVLRLVTEGTDAGLVQDLRDDLIPLLVVLVAFVVFLVVVFRRDARDPHEEAHTTE